MKHLAGGVAVITGAASGLGREFANSAAAHGMKLVLADVQQEALDKTVKEFASNGTETIGLRTDVSKLEDVQALADKAIRTFGKVNLIFNNAGVTAGGLVWENTSKDWEWVLGVNLFGVIHGLQVFTPLMLAEASKNEAYEGHIVNTASMAGLVTAPAMGIYGVSKHAVVALSESLYHDLGLLTEKVRCSVLCPSYVPTAIGQSDRNRPGTLSNDTPLTKSQLIARTMSQNSVASGTVTATQVSEVTFDAVLRGDFYIYPSPQALAAVRPRFDDIVEQRNPSDWFAANPERRARRERLVEALREHA